MQEEVVWCDHPWFEYIWKCIFRWHKICVLWCVKEVLFNFFSAASSNKLNYRFKIVWVNPAFLYQQPCNLKKASDNKTICSCHRNFCRRAASCNSFQTSARRLLRLSKANLFETTSLWRCVCKCLLALRVGWSPNVPTLLTNGVAVITGGAKVEHVFTIFLEHYHPFPQLLK